MSSCSEDDQEESGNEREESEVESSKSEENDDDEEKNAFKLKPLDPQKDFNADGTKKFQAKTRLMLQLEKIDPNQGDSEEADNSFADQEEDVEESEDTEEEEEEYASEEEEASPLKHDESDGEQESPDRKVESPKPKKYRKNVMNVACTDYEVIRRVAKRYLNYRLKEYDEDHEGAVVNGEGNQKLSTDWDFSWHDLGITADYLSKMLPY